MKETKTEFLNEKYWVCAEKDAKWLVTRSDNVEFTTKNGTGEVWVDLKAKNRPPKRG